MFIPAISMSVQTYRFERSYRADNYWERNYFKMRSDSSSKALRRRRSEIEAVLVQDLPHGTNRWVCDVALLGKVPVRRRLKLNTKRSR